MDDKTLTVTFTMHLKEPLTPDEKESIIGNLWEHIHQEAFNADCAEGYPGFNKIAEVDSPDGKYRASIRDVWDVIANEFRSAAGTARQSKRK
jgi:hypothetical protein